MAKKKAKRSIISKAFIFIIIFVVIGFGWLYRNKIKDDSEMKEVTYVFSVFEKYGNQYGLNTTYSDNGSLTWVTDEAVISVGNAQNTRLPYPCSDWPSYPEEFPADKLIDKDSEQEKVVNLFKSFADPIDEYMISRGYSLDETNSSLNDESYITWEYMYRRGYTKDERKCVYTANTSCGGSGYLSWPISFSCSDGFKESYDEQIQYFKDLELDRSEQIKDITQAGDFVKLKYGNPWGGGSRLVAKKIDGKWTEIFSGQNLPYCEVLNEYKVPSILEDKCFEELQNGELIEKDYSDTR